MKAEVKGGDDFHEKHSLDNINLILTEWGFKKKCTYKRQNTLTNTHPANPAGD
jgi:hypothetical protein